MLVYASVLCTHGDLNVGVRYCPLYLMFEIGSHAASGT